MDDRLARTIYGPDVYKEGHLPARVVADGGQSYGMGGVVHAPGLNGTTVPLPTDKPYHGYMGVTVRSYLVPINAQPVGLAWSAIDIDAEDNPGWTYDTMFEKLRDTFKHRAVIRTSKSGKGFHLIFPVFRLEGYRAPEQMSWFLAKHEARRAVHGEAGHLIDSGITPCVTGLVNLWLWSKDGAQTTLFVPEGWDAG
jgi:hypothetical protein